MKTLYLDCPMGISGDMFLAALIDLGVDPKMILRELKKLPVDKIDVEIKKAARHSITGTTFKVKLAEAHHHRTFRDIKKIIGESNLAPKVKSLSTAIFKVIAEAEGKIHGIKADEVHFHEIGAMDSIIDIVGAAVAVDSLKVKKVVSSPIALGTGWARTMHGTIPIPAPATLEILKGVPTAASTAPFELTTPTGAAIVKTLASSFGPMPPMTIESAGYGAGKKDFKESANLLRAVIGSSSEGAEGAERLILLETNIDDMSPQVAGYLMERLLSEGALDAFYTPVQMKKGRPGVLLTVLTGSENKDSLLEVIFAESTTIGVRETAVLRHCLERKEAKVKTPYGVVRVKLALRAGRAVNVQPEYEDCRTAAQKKGVALKLVMDAAREAARGLV
ncbi:Pyridinium-3,5-bisthiocarboxylic acid mononucleotide nickel insertion protein [uncultured bacterium]|nr:Pyridinium-3,5-bisthiocarboxylic acid mononucleotide nickel insertion protein [uncultured bacterium]